MKKYTPMELFRLLAAPAATVLLGLVLLLSPDTASALVGKLLAWCSILAAAGFGIGAISGAPDKKADRILWAAIFFFGGIWMLMNPLTIARFLGRVLGLSLALLGARSTAGSIRYAGRKLVLSRELILGAVTILTGCVLVLLPMTGSRIFFKVLGVALICFGFVQGRNKLLDRKQLDQGDSDIIDVEKV